MLKPIVLTAAAITLSACATVRNPERSDGLVRINPASLAADPARWDGRQVEVVGLVVWESDVQALYQSYGAYCRGAEKAAVAVNWNNWPAVSRADSRRRVIVRGVFHNLPGAAPPGGMPANSGPGPGPLQPGFVVGWLSSRAKPCPLARP
jgi:hypothetical protein